MAKVLYTWFTKLTLLKFGLQFMLPQLLENKSRMIFMLMFSGTEHKYIIQVDQHKIINLLPHRTIHHSKKLMGHYKVQVAVQCTQTDHTWSQMLFSLKHL